MVGMRFISCIRFSMQLLMAEAFFVSTWKRKKQFPVKIMAGIAGYFLMAWLVFYIFINIPGDHPVIYTAYYGSLFCLSLGVMRIGFQITGKDILFAGVCGYATQHIGFAVSMIIQ